MIRDRGLRLLHLWRIGDFYEAQKGDRFRSEWTSLRFSPFTRGWDGVDHYHPMVRPFPFPSGSFDAVYARRIVEHLVLAEADQFMSELHRLCVPGAVVRLCVPDFEEMCRSYLLATEKAWETDDPADIRRQELLVIECVDQMVRERSGGFLDRQFAAADTTRPSFASVTVMYSKPCSRKKTGRREEDAAGRLRGYLEGCAVVPGTWRVGRTRVERERTTAGCTIE